MPQPSRRGGRSSTRRSTPQSPGKPSALPGAGRNYTADFEVAQTHLATVPEGIPALPALPADPPGLVQDEIEEPAPSHAPIDHSSSSQQELDPQQELDALNYHVILNLLPDLRDEAVKLLSNFHRKHQDDLVAYLRTFRGPAGTSTTLCLVALEKFLAIRREFGSRPWALPPIIVRWLKNGQPWPEIADGMWRPDAILYLANLAQFVASLVLRVPEVPSSRQLLTDACVFYPGLFSSIEPDNRFTSPDIAGLLRIGDELRTQFFLEEARAALDDPAFHPEDLLARIFSDREYKERIEPLVACVPSYASDLEARLARIRASFSQTNPKVLIANLQDAFPWEAFVVELITWALQREQELRALIEAQDAGIEGIVNAIKFENFNIAANPVRGGANNTAAALTEATGRNLPKTGVRETRGQGSRKAKYIAALKKDQADLAARRTAIASANIFETQNTVNAATDTQNPLHESTDTGGYAPVPQFDDDGLPESAQPPRQPSPTQLSGDSQNAWATEIAKGAIIQVEPPLLPPEASYRDINTKAKANVAMTRERDQSHTIQQRQPYSEAEVRRLIELIGLNHGPKYAKILKDDEAHPDGPLLSRRTQVQLKDKARNIKMDYLKARQPLPEGFAAVSIGQRLIDVLRSMGIELVDGQPDSLLPHH
ncbi:hypothetical protein DV738_g2427, partial [Chaetothyriales sp. CBS 135597]